MLVRVRTISSAAVVAGLLMSTVGTPDAGAVHVIAPSMRAEFLAEALSTAQRNGDPHPYDIEVISTTRIRALRVGSGGMEPMCESSPACANSPTYVIAMRGRFICGRCSGPANSPIPRGTVITLVYNPSTMFGETFSLGNTYPRLAAAGMPVRLDRPRAHRRAVERRRS
jgi:hypothetical protein